MIGDLTFRQAKRNDMPALLALFKQLYPNLGWTSEFMRWQYFDNPAGEAKVWICCDQEKPVGSVTALPHIIWTFDCQVVGYRVQDVMTAPEYRGLSIYKKLSERCYSFLDCQEMAVHFTFPNENSERVFRSSNWTPVSEIPLWTAQPLKKNKDFEVFDDIRLLENFSKEEEEIWSSYRKLDFFGIDKNQSFLNWKYFSNPRTNYQCYFIDGRNTNVILVLKEFFFNASTTLIHICDLFYTEYCEDLLKGVFSFIHKKANIEKASTITTWIAPNHELATVASAMGFSYSPVTTRSYFLRSSNLKMHDYFSKWNIRMGDSDVY